MRLWNTTSTVQRVVQSILMVGLIALFISSCEEMNTSSVQQDGVQQDETPSVQEGMAHMDVHLTDAPAVFQEVNIEVQGLRIHFTPSSQDTASGDTTEGGKWIDLPVDTLQINLLELQDVDTLLASTDLEPGTYREFRLLLGDNNTVMVDSTTHDLKVPSGQQSGYKIKFSTQLEEGEEIEVLIDFDASKSVHEAGESGKFVLKPVLKATVEDGNGNQEE